MTMKVTIRPYADSDLEDVILVVQDLQIVERAFHDRMRDPADINANYVHAVRKEAEDCGGGLIVAELAGVVVGYCTLLTRCDSRKDHEEIYYEYAHVGDLAVRAGNRGQNIGANLIAECERQARAAGIKWLRLCVLADNARARKFYNAQGFGERLIRLEKSL
jgi:ribosomal protein S18 acetylase RimI-like enzyme